jgi:cytochrome c oxidase subunit 4
MAEHVASRKFYVLIWVVLMLLTGLTAGVSRIDMGIANAPIAVLIAAVKATLVALFFMHMRWNSRQVRIAGIFGLVMMLIMFALTLSDFFTRYGLAYPHQ